MAYYPFSQRPGMLAFTCTHVMDELSPVLLVTHHFDDGSWEFLCDRPAHADTDAVIITIGELLALDASLEAVSDLPVGCCATRTDKHADWVFSRLDGEPWYPASADRMPDKK